MSERSGVYISSSEKASRKLTRRIPVEKSVSKVKRFIRSLAERVAQDVEILDR